MHKDALYSFTVKTIILCITAFVFTSILIAAYSLVSCSMSMLSASYGVSGYAFFDEKSHAGQPSVSYYYGEGLSGNTDCISILNRSIGSVSSYWQGCVSVTEGNGGLTGEIKYKGIDPQVNINTTIASTQYNSVVNMEYGIHCISYTITTYPLFWNGYCTDQMQDFTMAHEYGHVFGFAENNTNGVVMKQGYFASTSASTKEIRGMLLLTHQHIHEIDANNEVLAAANCSWQTEKDIAFHYEVCDYCYAYKSKEAHSYMISDIQGSYTCNGLSYRLPTGNDTGIVPLNETTHGFTCTECGRNYPVGEHALSPSSDGHSCAVCGYTADHNYVYQQQNSSGFHVCTGCGDTLVGEHINGWISVDHDSHSRICTICHVVFETEHHNYIGQPENAAGNGAQVPEQRDHIDHDEPGEEEPGNRLVQLPGPDSDSCNACGYTPVFADHQFFEQYLYNQDYHWLECSCSYRTGFEYHESSYVPVGDGENRCSEEEVPDPEREEGNDEAPMPLPILRDGLRSDSDLYHHSVCTECGIELTAPEQHCFTYSDMGSYHIISCAVCGYENTEDHIFGAYASNGSSGHSQTCLCGHTASTGHNYGSWYSNGSSTHSRVCEDCGYIDTEGHNLNYTNLNSTQHQISCSVCGYEVNQAHSMAGWTSTGSSGHENHCTQCGYSTTGSHSANSYTSSGSSGHTATCLACSASFSESHAYPSDWTSISNSKHAKTCTAAGCGYQKTANHSFGAWTSDNDSTHQHTCTVCDKTVTASHTWGAGTSLNNSKHTKTCTTCSRSKTENHSMAGWTSMGNTGHSNACVACNYVSTGSHSASSYTSTNASYHTGTCTVCSAGFTASHGYPSSWSHNSTKHYKTCTANGCGYQVKADHSFGEWYNNNGVHTHECTVCGRTATGSHSWSSWTSISSSQHERTCGCGASQTGSHSYGDWVNHSEAQHKHSCTSCGRTVYANHSFGSWTSTGASQHKHTCSVCSKVVTVNHDHWTYQYYSAAQHKKRCTTCTSAWYFEAHTPQYTGGIYICSKCGVTLE